MHEHQWPGQAKQLQSPNNNNFYLCQPFIHKYVLFLSLSLKIVLWRH